MANLVFQRFELKYVLSPKQYNIMKKVMEERLQPDTYGEATVQSLYLDTDNYRLVRASIEKPAFKEKLRIRCYGLNDSDKDIFVEMKRKAEGVVYKRRLSCKEGDVPALLSGHPPKTQIGGELEYFLNYYGGLAPRIMVLYDRCAFYDRDSSLRVTFDRNIRYRKENLNFSTSLEGEPLTEKGTVIMEIKSSGAIPLWLCKVLSEEHIAKTSFSKYGTAYQRECLKNTDFWRNQICLNPFSQTEALTQPAFSPC